MALRIFGGGAVGANVSALNTNGQSQSGVVPAITLVDQNGAAAGSGTSTNPNIIQTQGAGTIATSQPTSSLSPAAATQVVAARTGRQSVTITNITGAQPVYLGPSSVTVSTGYFLAGTIGASVTIHTSAAIYATSPTASQTLGVVEAY